MSLSTNLSTAIDRRGLTLDSEGSIFTIENSTTIPKRIAEEIILSVNHCPIISQNRIDGLLEFTVVPYRAPTRFQPVVCNTVAMTEDNFWGKVESTTSRIEEGKPISILGRQIFPSLTEAKREMVQGCTKISDLMVEFIDRAPNQGRVLDLGCGQGVNSIPLLEKGWHVTAIDNAPEALAMYREAVSARSIGSDRLKLINADITTHSFSPLNYDLIICIDVLPYIDSKKLRSVMMKIHESLVLNGQVIGTLFFSLTHSPPVTQELQEKLGAHFYPGDYIAPALLKNTGFLDDECTIRTDSKLEPCCAQFVGTKKAI